MFPCPNCSAFVTPGATDCARCGYVLTRGRDELEELAAKAEALSLTPAAIRDDLRRTTEGFFRFERLDNYFLLVIAVGVLLGLGLREDLVREWEWVPGFVASVRDVVPVVDAFWRVSPFPTVAQLIPAIIWPLAVVLGFVAIFTVRYSNLPGMTLSRRAFLEITFCMLLAIAIWAFGGGALTPERVEHGTRYVRALGLVSRQQWLFGVMAGVIGGAVAALWGGVCVLTFGRGMAVWRRRSSRGARL
jgi:hypothetical protein